MKKSLIALSLAMAVSALADGHGHKHDEHKHDHDDDKVEHIGAHVHGIAALNVVLDGDDLEVELDTPAMNVMGFEHEPKAEADLKSSHDALHALEDGEWLVINGGDCKLEDSDVDWEFAEQVHDHFHGDDKDKKDDHKHEHKDEHKHDHDDHKHDDGETHSDVETEHEFECDKPKDVKSITVNLFDNFKGFEKINVQWIVNDKQGATTLTKDNRVIKLQ